jgi:hypothetical protein
MPDGIIIVAADDPGACGTGPRKVAQSRVVRVVRVAEEHGRWEPCVVLVKDLFVLLDNLNTITCAGIGEQGARYGLVGVLGEADRVPHKTVHGQQLPERTFGDAHHER